MAADVRQGARRIACSAGPKIVGRGTLSCSSQNVQDVVIIWSVGFKMRTKSGIDRDRAESLGNAWNEQIKGVEFRRLYFECQRGLRRVGAKHLAVGHGLGEFVVARGASAGYRRLR